MVEVGPGWMKYIKSDIGVPYVRFVEVKFHQTCQMSKKMAKNFFINQELISILVKSY